MNFTLHHQQAASVSLAGKDNQGALMSGLNRCHLRGPYPPTRKYCNVKENSPSLILLNN